MKINDEEFNCYVSKINEVLSLLTITSKKLKDVSLIVNKWYENEVEIVDEQKKIIKDLEKEFKYVYSELIKFVEE